MEFTPILSGKEKVQILHRGFRLKHNKGPQGPSKTSYFTCVIPGCKARAATLGDLNVKDLTLKYHHVEQHSHHADLTKNIVSEKLYQFRENAKQNPDTTAKAVYERLTAEAINSVDTPDKNKLAAELPKFHAVKDQHYRQRKKLRPNLPKTLAEVDIESYGDLTTTERGHPFYRGKIKTTCVELWMSDLQIDIAGEATSINFDCTFGTTPELWYQTGVVRAKVDENTYTIATALLPNKEQKT